MFHPIEDFHKYIQPGKRVHLAGIGGVSMCALAEVLQGMGVTVQGSDMSDSATVQHLRSVGIPVAVGHSAENLKNCDAVIRTILRSELNIHPDTIFPQIKYFQYLNAKHYTGYNPRKDKQDKLVPYYLFHSAL